MNQINKVLNLAWFCIDCHKYVHETMKPEAAGRKIIKKVEKYRTKLKTI